jgi:hypothetical protein
MRPGVDGERDDVVEITAPLSFAPRQLRPSTITTNHA